MDKVQLTVVERLLEEEVAQQIQAAAFVINGMQTQEVQELYGKPVQVISSRIYSLISRNVQFSPDDFNREERLRTLGQQYPDAMRAAVYYFLWKQSYGTFPANVENAIRCMMKNVLGIGEEAT